jgi:hypothetical protein
VSLGGREGAASITARLEVWRALEDAIQGDPVHAAAVLAGLPPELLPPDLLRPTLEALLGMYSVLLVEAADSEAAKSNAELRVQQLELSVTRIGVTTG